MSKIKTAFYIIGTVASVLTAEVLSETRNRNNNDCIVRTPTGDISSCVVEGVSREEASKLDSALERLFYDLVSSKNLRSEKPSFSDRYSLKSVPGSVIGDSLPVYLGRVVSDAGFRVEYTLGFLGIESEPLGH